MFDPKTRILIVDDAMTMRFFIKKLLNGLGYNDISEAKNGAEAWKAITSESTPFGLVISDWNMPGSTGMDLLNKLRSDEKYGKTPFLMVTAESDRDQVVAAIKAGADSYLVKPVTAPALSEKIKTVFQKKAAA